MASLNRVTLIGNLGRDIEVRYGANGGSFANVSLACTERWKDKSTGEQKEATEWVNLVFYDRLAEVAGEYLSKGRQIYVDGKLRTRKWQDQAGNDRYTTEVVVQQLVMLGSRDDASPARDPASRDSAGYGSHRGGGSPQPQRRAAPSATQGGLADMDDDIPF